MKKPGNIISLELLAASQWGMFTTAQAQELGIRQNQVFRMVSALRVEPICFGVYRFIAGAQPPQADLKAEWLSVFPKQKAAERLTLRPYDAVMAGRTAAVALDADDFHASPYTFIVSRRRQTSREDIRFLHCRLSEIDVRCCRRSSSTATSPRRTARPWTGPSMTRSTSRAPSPGSPSSRRSSPSHAHAHSPRAWPPSLHASSSPSPNPWASACSALSTQTPLPDPSSPRRASPPSRQQQRHRVHPRHVRHKALFISPKRGLKNSTRAKKA